MRWILSLLLLFLVAAAPAAPPISREQAAAALGVLENPASRDAFIATLKTIVQGTAPPAAAADEAQKNTGAGGHDDASQTPESHPLAVPLAPGSLGAQSLIHFSAALSAVGPALRRAFRAVISISLLSIWIATVKGDPFLHKQLLATAWRMIVIVGFGLAVERAAIWALIRPRLALLRLAEKARVPESEKRRRSKGRAKSTTNDAKGEKLQGATRHPNGDAAFPLLHHARSASFAALAFLLDLSPLALFAAAAYGVLETEVGAVEVPRLAILAIVNAYLVTRIALCLVRLVLAADRAPFRLVPVGDAGAAYALLWARRIIGVSVFGYAIAEVALLFGLYDSLHLALLKLIALVVHLFVAVIILQQRLVVRDLISPPAEASGPLAQLRRIAARSWHYVAVLYVMTLWLLWAIGVPHGFMTLLQFLITALVVATAAWGLRRLMLSFLTRHLQMRRKLAERYPAYERRVRRYLQASQTLLSFVIAVVAFLVLLEFWGVDAFGWFTAGGFGGRIVGALVVIGITVAAALFIWEATNAAIERHLARLAKDGQAVRAARINTLLPLLRATLIVVIVVFVGLTALSQIGVDIAPLLAGAGVIGIAIGFGSQKLVQDVITGLFLLLENAMQVGDTVTLGGLSGVVENVSVRSIRLRDSDGSVHLIPFSAVSTVTNQTRDFGYAVFNVSVGYEEDADRVIVVLKGIIKEMRREPEWATIIRDELEVWGLDKLGATSQLIICRVQTGPADRWAVGREFNRRMKQKFDALGIEMAYPTQRLLMDTLPSNYIRREKKDFPRGVLP